MGKILNEAINGYTLSSNGFSDFKLLRSNTDTNLAGMPAYILEGQYMDPQLGKQMVVEIGTIKDNLNYFICYLASPSQYLNYSDEVRTMIDSFEIQN